MPPELSWPRLTTSRRSLARAFTLVENGSSGAIELLKSAFPHTGGALVAGITGAPGAGKSTLTSALITELRGRGHRVAVIAVDPSSPFTGGAILGDRIRMQCHHSDDGVFIRSMATRGAMGGLAPATHDVALLLDAAGFDVVLIETVGVGQDEVDIARLAQTTAVVLAPGMGDGIQAIKAGILEIAHLFVINKSDLAGAARLADELADWAIPILRTIATEGAGIGPVADAILARRSQSDPVAHWALRLRQMYAQSLTSCLDSATVQRAAQRVAGRECDPYTIIEEWLRV